MTIWQYLIVGGWGIAALMAAFQGVKFTIREKNPFGLSRRWEWLGIFVWVDAPIIGSFWVLACGVALLSDSWWLFCLTGSIFWVIRSLGETIYWLNNQHAHNPRNPPDSLRGYKWFPGESIWVVYQIGWQTIFVLATVAAIYSAYRWLI